jgi:hypothetical protein
MEKKANVDTLSGVDATSQGVIGLITNEATDNLRSNIL